MRGPPSLTAVEITPYHSSIVLEKKIIYLQLSTWPIPRTTISLVHNFIFFCKVLLSSPLYRAHTSKEQYVFICYWKKYFTSFFYCCLSSSCTSGWPACEHIKFNILLFFCFIFYLRAYSCILFSSFAGQSKRILNSKVIKNQPKGILFSYASKLIRKKLNQVKKKTKSKLSEIERGHMHEL